jgi:hypothetical protein
MVRQAVLVDHPEVGCVGSDEIDSTIADQLHEYVVLELRATIDQLVGMRDQRARARTMVSLYLSTSAAEVRTVSCLPSLG